MSRTLPAIPRLRHLCRGELPALFLKSGVAREAFKLPRSSKPTTSIVAACDEPGCAGERMCTSDTAPRRRPQSIVTDAPAHTPREAVAGGGGTLRRRQIVNRCAILSWRRATRFGLERLGQALTRRQVISRSAPSQRIARLGVAGRDHRCGHRHTLPRDRAWPGAGRRVDAGRMFPPRNHRSQGRRHDADSHGARRQRAHLSHPYVSVSTITAMSSSGNVRRRDRPLALQGQVEDRQAPRQVKRRPAHAAGAGRDHRVHRLKMPVPASSIGDRRQRACSRSASARGAKRLAPGDGAAGGRGVLRPDFYRGREEHAIQRPR